MDMHDNAVDYEMHEAANDLNGAKREGTISTISESESSTAQPSIAKISEAVQAVDRQRTCPMYVRIFCRINGHHTANEFGPKRQPIDDELVVYTWKDATLGELADLIKEVNEESRRKEVTFDFQLVYADLRGHFMFKPMGRVSNSKPSKEAKKSLESVRFRQGDYIDVAIYLGAIPLPPLESYSHSSHSNHSKRPRYAPMRRSR